MELTRRNNKRMTRLYKEYLDNKNGDSLYNVYRHIFTSQKIMIECGLSMTKSRYWFIEFESGEYAGAEFETALDSQEVHDRLLENEGMEIIYCWPCHKWELYYSELDIY